MHKQFLREFKNYLICGGLPYCVNDFLTQNDITSLRKTQDMIFELYGNDAAKYDLDNKLHTKAIYDLVPSTIENKKKRIKIKDIEGRGNRKFSEYEEDFETLVGSGIVLEVKCCTDPKFPLKQSAKNSMLKLYMNDVGLLTSQLFKYNIKPFLEDAPQVNLGNIYETVAAILLFARGNKLYYSDSKKAGEVDFLIDDYDSANIKAIEIKSGKDYKIHSAFRKLMLSKDAPAEGIVFSNSGRIEKEGNITYLPIYGLMFF